MGRQVAAPAHLRHGPRARVGEPRTDSSWNVAVREEDDGEPRRHPRDARPHHHRQDWPSTDGNAASRPHPVSPPRPGSLTPPPRVAIPFTVLLRTSAPPGKSIPALGLL